MCKIQGCPAEALNLIEKIPQEKDRETVNQLYNHPAKK